MPARIKGRHKEYRELTNVECVINMVRRGYQLVFEDDPPAASFTANNCSALEDNAFVRAQLERLESLGCIGRVEEQPLVVLPVSSVFSKKWRSCWTPLGTSICGTRGEVSS